MEINNTKSIINFLAYYSELVLSLEFDFTNMKLIASNPKTKAIHPYFDNRLYIRIEIYRDGNVIHRENIYGRNTTDAVVERLNNFSLQQGDYLKFYHAEQNRIKLLGPIENAPMDLSINWIGLDLENSYFYIKPTELYYSNKVLNAREYLKDLVDKGRNLNPLDYEYYSFLNLSKTMERAQLLLDNPDSNSSDIDREITNMLNFVKALTPSSKIIFKGTDHLPALTIYFNYDTKRLVATGTTTPINTSFGSNKYCSISIFSKKGILKLNYLLRGVDNTTEIANILNNMPYNSEEDYIKFTHEDKNLLVIEGVVENAPSKLDINCNSLNLDSSYFYVNTNILSYEAHLKDISGDKSQLKNLIADCKTLNPNVYIRESYISLQRELNRAEDIINTPLVSDDEITDETLLLQSCKNSLKLKNTILVCGIDKTSTLGSHIGEKCAGITFDEITNRLSVKQYHYFPIHPYFDGRLYFSITFYDKNGNEKCNCAMNGNEKVAHLILKLNNYKYEVGDYVKFFHAEPSRLKLQGYIENAPCDLARGCHSIDLTTSCFRFDEDNLVYFTETNN